MEERNQEEAEERVSKALEAADRVLGGEAQLLEDMGELTPERLEALEAEQLPEEAIVMSRAIPAGTAMVSIAPGLAPSFAKHLDAAKRILEIATTREILNEVDAKLANDDLTVMLELKKAIDEERKTFTVPLNEYLATINGAYKQITEPLLEAEQVTRRILTVYKLEQQRKAKEVEELNRQAMEVARKQAELNQGEFTTDIKPVPVPLAPKLTRTDQGTSGLVANWKYEIIDIDLLPREYMVPDEDMLKSIAKNQHDKKQIPGIRFFNEPGLRVRR